MQGKLLAIVFLVHFVGNVQAQKGEKSIAAGLLLSFPTQNAIYTKGTLQTGFGLELTGQSNISQNSVLLLQTSLVSHGYDPYPVRTSDDRLVLFSLRGGYRYQFGATGIFLNVLPGLDIDLSDFYVPLTFSIGAGKRFRVKNVYYIDVGC